MSKLTQIPKWLLKAWPVLAFIPIGFLHYYLLHMFPSSRPMVHKVLSATFQSLGGVIIVYSINDNMGVLKNENIFRIIWNWLRSFPLIRRSAVVGVMGVGGLGITGSAEAHVSRRCDTLEDRVEELERQLTYCRELIYRKEREILSNLSSVRTDLEKQLATHSDNLNQLSRKIESSIVGSFKSQIFGICLAIYGAVISIFA
jgi:hypothetical protein